MIRNEMRCEPFPLCRTVSCHILPDGWELHKNQNIKCWKLEGKQCQNWTYVTCVCVTHNRQTVKMHTVHAFQFLNKNNDAQALLLVVVFCFVAVAFSLLVFFFVLFMLLIFSFNASYRLLWYRSAHNQTHTNFQLFNLGVTRALYWENRGEEHA